MLLTVAFAASLSIVVIDGDTIDVNGERIRIANIDAPEIRGAKCDAEKRLGIVAKHRLEQLVQAGRLEIIPGDPKNGRVRDRHGRTLATIRIDGDDVGEILIRDSIAREWSGRREPWCE